MMSAEQPSTFSLWPYLTALAAILPGLAALLGWWLSRRRAPVSDRLITAQTEQVESDIIHKSIDASVRTGEFTLKALEMAEATIDRLNARKEALETKLDRDMEELRQQIKEMDDKQADIFLILGERRKAEKQEGE